MAEQNKKQEEKPKKAFFEPSGFADKWGVKKYLTEVQSDIKSDVTSDFILAKLDTRQKESIIELIRDAYFAKKEIEKLVNYKRYVPIENGKWQREIDGSFTKVGLSDDEKDYIRATAKITFNSFMIKIYMVVIMYRNEDKNVLLERIAESEKENIELEEEREELGKRIKENVKKGEKD